jgi:hypothetical protein
MANTIELYRDKLVLDDSLVARIKNGWRGMPAAQPGDTIVLGARFLTVRTTQDILPAYNLVLLADNLRISFGTTIRAVATKENPSPSVTVLARYIGQELTQFEEAPKPAHFPDVQNAHASTMQQRKALLRTSRNLGGPFQLMDEALNITISGYTGSTGKAGRAGHTEYEGTSPGHLPRSGSSVSQERKLEPQMPAMKGGTGETGGPGGKIVVRYEHATLSPVLSAPGGVGGRGGPGDLIDEAAPRGSASIPAQPGRGGQGGPGGTVEVSHIDADNPTANAAGGSGGPGGVADKDGAAGRSGPAGEKGRDGSVSIREIAGIEEVWAAIPTKEIASHWAAFRAEVGEHFFRCFDNLSMISAIKELQAATMLDPANTHASILLSRVLNGQTPGGLGRYVDIVPDYKDLVESVKDSTQHVLNAFLSAQIDTITTDVCSNAKRQLSAARDMAQVELDRAQGELLIDKAQVEKLSSDAAKIQQQLDDLANQSFSILDVVSTVGAVAAAVGSIASGVGLIISIPSSLIAIGDLAENSENLVAFLQQKELTKDLTQLGQGLEGLLKSGQGMINLKKVIAQIEDAMSQSGQGDAGDLLKQLAQAKWEETIANLRLTQAQDYCDGLEHAIALDNTEINNINTLMNSDLIPGTLRLLRQARAFASQVSEELFLSLRALEIYELDTPVIRFDYGYVWPDDEHDCIDLQDSVHDLVRASYSSALELPQDLATWESIYNWTNVSEGNCDVVHANTPVTILADEAVRTALTPGNALRFTVEIDDVPPDIYEDKVNGLLVDLVGATADESIMLWVEHSGHYRMRHRDTGEIEEFFLLPHQEVCNCTSSTIGLSGQIPFTTPSSAEPGPPFAFWGRGLAADWVLYLEPETPDAAHFDISELRKVVVTFRGLGFTPRADQMPQMPIVRVHARPIIGWHATPLAKVPMQSTKALAEKREGLELVGTGPSRSTPLPAALPRTA